MRQTERYLWLDRIKELAPRLKPNIIVIESYVNDFEDALKSNREFQEEICFQCPNSTGLSSMLDLKDLRDWLKIHIFERPRRDGLLADTSGLYAFYRGVPYVEKSNEPRFREGARVYEKSLREISSIASTLGAHVLIVQVPAAAQVCPRKVPAWIDLTDKQQFDLDLPQRLLREIAEPLGIPVVDLRGVLRGNEPCPYFDDIMYWNEAGHRIVADYLTGILVQAHGS
ncbi:MAG TPA: hypothetical protein VF550_13420 [Polyangia bacterium]